ncbi:Gfo/Idh/MocA family oxidoreductase [Sulfitobacter sp. D35]|uniref:Gfo/Idh/MocA family protein n=1 Tax=Sulfitobacter sp. D35 TaxID=3083252 RepID=UPI00296F9A5C|nr:Gfo/Idh/MocA family oxidoreductase [Sulfitobacter sp. D35]MDW4497379.1 Gfo/Idh/MocA family oxidoreductase [Sulfitobacter sp. D35]
MAGIAVAGAGLIGTRHLAALRAAGLAIHSVIDPLPETAEVAQAYGVAHHTSLAAALAAGPSGVVLATPNSHHKDGALECIAAGVPVLIEKPIATGLADARRIVEAGEAAGVAVLTGHHRRHLPVVSAARERIERGALGRIVAAHAMFWLAKPDSYFETPWRRAAGAGPTFMNLIHDIDMLRFLLGDVVQVQAVQSNAVRGNPIEDACAAVLTFEGGVLCTVQASDAIVAPWSYELTAHDNPAYPPTGENAVWIGGTHASLALPRGEEWSDGGKRDWWQPISRTTLLRAAGDPLVAQMQNFAAVIRGDAAPVCSGRDGMESLAVLIAIRTAAATGGAVVPGEDG